MSFYGNALYQVVRSFAEARLKSGAANSTEVSNPNPAESIIEAENRAGQIAFASGTKWIGLDMKKEKFDEGTKQETSIDTIKLYHEKPSKDFVGGTTQVIRKIASDEPNKEVQINLAYDDKLEFKSIVCDNAGHVKESVSTIVKMPATPEDLANLDELEDRISNIETTLEDYDTITSQVDTNKTNITTLQGDLDLAENDIYQLQQFETNAINNFDTQNDFNQTVSGETTYDALGNPINDLINLLKLTNVKNLAEVFGNLNPIQENLLPNATHFTIADIFNKLNEQDRAYSNEISQLNSGLDSNQIVANTAYNKAISVEEAISGQSGINDQISSLQNTIIGLEARIKILEDRLNNKNILFVE